MREGRCDSQREEGGLHSVVGIVIELSRELEVEVTMGSSATMEKNHILKQ